MEVTEGQGEVLQAEELGAGGAWSQMILITEEEMPAERLRQGARVEGLGVEGERWEKSEQSGFETSTTGQL